MEFLQEKKILKEIISRKRFEHSCRVAETSKDIAKKLNYDENIAYLAGLLHDCAKDISINDTRFDFSLTEKKFYREFPNIWHSFYVEKIGNYFFSHISKNVFEAAKYHSTGAKNMTVLAKILFVSDYIEPGRPYINDQGLLNLAKANIDNVVYEVSRLKLIYLLKQKEKIHHYLFECYDFYNN